MLIFRPFLRIPIATGAAITAITGAIAVRGVAIAARGVAIERVDHFAIRSGSLR